MAENQMLPAHFYYLFWFFLPLCAYLQAFLPSCTHYDLLIRYPVLHSGCGCPKAWVTWLYLFNITDLGQQWKNSVCAPNPSWHISHQIWVLAAPIVFNCSVGWLISKPAMSLWLQQQRNSAFFLFFHFLWHWCCWPYPFSLAFRLSSFAPLCQAGHQITTST